MAEPKHRDWIKLWVKDCLIGSIRFELNSEERGVWYDCLLMAGNSRVPGMICANETTPLPIAQMARFLNIDQDLLELCLEKFKASGRIQYDTLGLIHIINWERYQYSEYDRQKAHRDKTPEALKVELPDWINRDTWLAFIDMRMKMKVPLTEQAVKMMMTHLRRLKDDGDDPNLVLEQSILNNWRGVFPLKGVRNGANQKHLEAARTGNYTKPPAYSD